MASTGGKKAEGAPLSREVLGHLMGVMHAMKDHVAALAATLDLTPSQLAALSHLDEPRSQRELAESLHFDASNITDIVDRLEARGLVERRPDPRDRRVKLLVTTDDGRDLRQRIQDQVFDRLPVLERLTAAQRRQLRDLLRRAVAAGAERS